jgi:hypothetical protein
MRQGIVPCAICDCFSDIMHDQIGMIER